MRAVFAFGEMKKPAPSIGRLFFAFTVIWIAGAGCLMWPRLPSEVPRGWPTVHLPSAPTYDADVTHGIGINCDIFGTQDIACYESSTVLFRPHRGLFRYLPTAETRRQDRDFLTWLLGVPFGLAIAGLGMAEVRGRLSI
jgi:hypothetical protein